MNVTIALTVPANIRTCDLLGALANVAAQYGLVVKQDSTITCADGSRIPEIRFAAKVVQIREAA